MLDKLRLTGMQSSHVSPRTAGIYHNDGNLIISHNPAIVLTSDQARIIGVHCLENGYDQSNLAADQKASVPATLQGMHQEICPHRRSEVFLHSLRICGRLTATGLGRADKVPTLKSLTALDRHVACAMPAEMFGNLLGVRYSTPALGADTPPLRPFALKAKSTNSLVS